MRAIRGWVSILAVVAGVNLVLVVILITTNIVLRFGFSYSLRGVIELVEWSLLIMGLWAAPLVLWNDEHVRVDLLTRMLSQKFPRVRHFLQFIIHGCIILVCAIMTYESFVVAKGMYVQATVTQSVLGFKIWPFYAVIPISFASMLMVESYKLIRHVRNGSILTHKPRQSEAA